MNTTTIKLATPLYDEVSYSYLYELEMNDNEIVSTIWWNDFYKKWERIPYYKIIEDWKEKIKKSLKLQGFWYNLCTIFLTNTSNNCKTTNT